MNIPSSPSTYAPVVPAYATVGHKPVGLESEEGRRGVIKPVEEGAGAAKSALQQRKPEPTGADLAETVVTLSADSASLQANSLAAAAEQKVVAQKEAAQREQIQSLAQRDREVRAHEQAHMAAGGAHAGAARYDFVKGPDGVSYAVAGEVPIDMGPASTPEATLEKAQTLQRAALAPADPSAQDRNVAAAAAQLELQALQQINMERQQKNRELGNEGEKPSQPLNAKASTESPPAQGVADSTSSDQEKDQVEAVIPGVQRNPYNSTEPEAGRLLDTSV